MGGEKGVLPSRRVGPRASGDPSQDKRADRPHGRLQRDRGTAVKGSPFLRGSASQGLLVIAHRGARSLAPENTLVAAEAARAVGAHLWEFDVETTRDGELILLHDETLSRTTDAPERYPDRAPWRAADLTWEEIKDLDAGSWFLREDPFGTLASGEVDPKRKSLYAGARIPTLREALSWTNENGLAANIELKGNRPALGLENDGRRTVEETVRVIRDLGMEDRVLVSSFAHAMVRHLKAVTPEVAGALLFHGLPPDPRPILEETGADAVAIRLPAFERGAARLLQEAGFGVYVWTVNGPEDLVRLAAEPFLAGIITDWPQRLLAILGRPR